MSFLSSNPSGLPSPSEEKLKPWKQSSAPYGNWPPPPPSPLWTSSLTTLLNLRTMASGCFSNVSNTASHVWRPLHSRFLLPATCFQKNVVVLNPSHLSGLCINLPYISIHSNHNLHSDMGLIMLIFLHKTYYHVPHYLCASFSAS